MEEPTKPSLPKFNKQTSDEQAEFMQQYYKLQSKIYDATRWSFLFGRRRIIQEIPLPKETTGTILEVGCGTGYNLKRLARQFPKAHLIGLDVSEDMVKLARKNTASAQARVEIIQAPYTTGHNLFPRPVDAVLFSYSLTMINPQWEELILQAKKDLRPGGIIAVTDFHDSRFSWFKKHMSNHHVRMDGHLKPLLETTFQPILNKVSSAYLGVWEFLLFTGKK
jgi:S-adenosylmethionine-diacylgycerolhomoserine-N-methlytransferase